MKKEIHDSISKSAILLSAEHYLYENDWHSMPHSHYFTEIFYVVNGKGEFSIEGNLFPVKKNNLIIINPHVSHTEVSVLNHPLEYIVLGIGNLRSELSELDFQVHYNHRYSDKLIPILKKMLEEIKHQLPHATHYCHALLYQFEIELYRLSDSNFISESNRSIPHECSVIKRHIDNYFKETITLDSLSDLVHWNKYYLAHQFKSAYGISPILYLQEQRILNSKNLLTGHDLNLSEISSICGFSSQSYFSQSFKRMTGLTPNEYRQRTLTTKK